MKREEYKKKYWNVYLLMESQFLETLNYITLSQDNFDTFSDKYVTLIRELGSEIDIIMKELSGFLQSDIKTITDYANVILENYPNINMQEIKANDILIKPFENWKKKQAAQSLIWWGVYNHIKHGRSEYFKEATMKITFYLLGALFILNKYLLKRVATEDDGIDAVEDESKLFIMLNWNSRYFFSDGYLMEDY